MKRGILFSLVMMLALSVALFAGGQAEPDEGPSGDIDLSQKEAPALAEMVANGEFPPLEERLPADPLVVEVDELGRYGGTMFVGATGSGQDVVSDSSSFLAFSPDHSQRLPNLAKDIEVSPDGRRFTIHLREGVKWSDGTPYTTEDIRFVVEEALLTDLVPAGIGLGSGVTPTLDVVDDYTITFVYEEPNAAFMDDMAAWQSRWLSTSPAHYYKTFHPDYVGEEEAAEMAEDAGFPDVGAFFRATTDVNEENTVVGKPTLAAWMLVEPRPGDPMVHERNPYFWAVDQEGRQLPYIDRVVHPLFGDKEVLILSVIAGDVDYTYRATATDLPLLLENAEQGGYVVQRWASPLESAETVQFNRSHPNPAYRELVNDPNWMIAMSHAIDREQINELVYQGLSPGPTQAGPTEASLFYDEELKTQYLEYNPERSVELLEEMGLTRGSDGFFDYANGDDLSVPFLISGGDENFEAVAELVVDSLNDVGIKANTRVLERAAYFPVFEANSEEFYATVFYGSDGLTPYSDPRNLVARQPWLSPWGVGWAIWHHASPDSNGAVEPPRAMKDSYELYGEISTTLDDDERLEISDEIIEIAKENLWVLGTVEPPPIPMPYSKRLRNIPDGSAVYRWNTRNNVQRAFTWWLDE